MNIAEILKYCPKGTKLYSTVYGEVEFNKIDKDIIYINVPYIIALFSDGKYKKEGECLLFPSKNQRDWNEFRIPAKPGDIMRVFGDSSVFIFKGYRRSGYSGFYCGIDSTGELVINDEFDSTWTSGLVVPASEEAKKELFDKMEEAGYRWNADTLELEKIKPKFKEGDVVVDKNNNLHLISSIDSGFIYAEITLYANGKLDINNNPTGYFNSTITLASKEEKNKLLSTLVRKGYKYDKEQHKLIKQEFKPFDKVLGRGDMYMTWTPDIFSYYNQEDDKYPYVCLGNCYSQCIPYEGNEYLLGTTDSPT